MTPDMINGLFEIIGSYFTWMNAITLLRDKETKGIYWPLVLFMTLWGFWNLIYYPCLNQWYSFAGGVFLTIGNSAWVILSIYYKRRKKNVIN